MTPKELTASSFSRYTPKAKERAVNALPVLRQLPLSFAPFLLKEVIVSEVQFPAELYELDSQLEYLNALPAGQLAIEMQPFVALNLDPKLEAFDWVNLPGQFLEQLSAYLWASHQMDSFRSASEIYVKKFHRSMKPQELAAARAGIAVLGEGVDAAGEYPLFTKLKREGTLYTQVQARDGLATLREALEDRARKYPGPYFHWSIDGGEAKQLDGFSTLSYEKLEPVRSALAARMLTAYEAQQFDPEKLRTILAQTTFESLGAKSSGDATLDHFSLTLLTEGSGTQIYSTTFVQWAARETLRRAQPITLFTHYAPRQKEKSMRELLGDYAGKTAEKDPLGSMIDGDMGAYYTWLNQQRLPGAENARYLAWFEGHGQAVVTGPGAKRDTVDGSPIDLRRLVEKVLLAV